jgi:hypothetical protein
VHGAVDARKNEFTARTNDGGSEHAMSRANAPYNGGQRVRAVFWNATGVLRVGAELRNARRSGLCETGGRNESG